MNSDSQRSSSPFKPVALVPTLDLLELGWRHKVAILLSILGFAACGLLYCNLATPMYQSSADVLLIHKRPEIVTRDARYESSFEDFVSTHLALIVSPLIVERAIEASSLRDLPSFADIPAEEDLVWYIIEELEAVSGPRSLGENADRIMTLTFQGPVPEDCPVVVQAVLDAYVAYLDEIYHGMSDDTLTLIDQAKGVLQNDLQQREQGYIEFRQQSPLVTRGGDEVSPLQDRLTAIETQRSDLLLRRAELEGQLRTIEGFEAGGTGPGSALAMLANLRSQTIRDDAGRTIPVSINNQLVTLRDQEQEALEFFGPQHPHVTTIRERIDATRRLLALPIGASAEDTAFTSDEVVQEYKQYLQQDLERIDVSERLLAELYDQQHERVKQLSSFQLKDESIRRGIDRTQQLYDVIISQLQEASLVKGYGGYEAHVIAEPLIGWKSSPQSTLILAASMVLGLCGGLGIAVVLELQNKSFRSRQEVHSRLGWPVAAQIPQFTSVPASASEDSSSSSGLDGRLCTLFQPRSLQTEEFRSLRTWLLFNRRVESPQVILLTGPSPNDGTSTVAANLAVSISQLGRRVLLIDADLHLPRQRSLFHLSDEPESDPAAQPTLAGATATSVDNLSVLSFAPWRAQGGEIFAAAAFSQLLAQARETYDVVLIDSEPLLTVSDPCVIASHADLLLLTLRATNDCRWRADRAKEILDSVGIQPAGVIINATHGAWRGYHIRQDASPAAANTNQPVGQTP